jgi:tetratricopeptide (TPR) repeat protein
MIPCLLRYRVVSIRIAVLIALAIFGVQAEVCPRGIGQESAGVTDKISKDWKRIRTAHFEAVSNAPVKKVREILGRLEVFHRNLVTKFLALKTASPVPTIVVVFKDTGAYSRFKPRGADGRKEMAGAYFLSSADMNHIVLPIELEGVKALQVIFHEYYHFAIQRNVPDIPRWMNEGLAEFFSTCEIDPVSGQVLIGRPINYHIYQLRQEELLPLDQMLTHSGAMKLLHSKDRRRISLFYAQSWALVHYLMISQDMKRQPQLNEYLDAIKKGMPTEQAFQTAFRMTFADMQRELRAYIASSKYYMMRLSQQPEDLPAESSVEALTEIEAEYLQGDLLMRISADNDAEQILKRILDRVPSYVPAKISLAAAMVGQDCHREAIDILRPIAEAEPSNFRAHFHLAQAYAKSELYEDSLLEYGRAAAANEQSTGPWLGITIATAILGRQAESDAAMERLQKLEANPRWYRVRAYETFKAGVYKSALGDAIKYIEKAGRGEESSPYMAFIGALCLLRLGQVSESEKLLEEVRLEISDDSWQMKVMRFMQGKTTAEKFLSLAKDVYERTEAHAYVGFKYLIDGQRPLAINHFRWVKEKGTKYYVEYGMAEAELKRLETDGENTSSGK